MNRSAGRVRVSSANIFLLFFFFLSFFLAPIFFGIDAPKRVYGRIGRWVTLGGTWRAFLKTCDERFCRYCLRGRAPWQSNTDDKRTRGISGRVGKRLFMMRRRATDSARNAGFKIGIACVESSNRPGWTSLLPSFLPPSLFLLVETMGYRWVRVSRGHPVYGDPVYISNAAAIFENSVEYPILWSAVTITASMNRSECTTSRGWTDHCATPPVIKLSRRSEFATSRPVDSRDNWRMGMERPVKRGRNGVVFYDRKTWICIFFSKVFKYLCESYQKGISQKIDFSLNIFIIT